MNELMVHLDFGDISYHAGTLYLSEKMGRYVFTYEREFVASGLEISPLRLPLGTDTFVAERNASLYDLHGVFADSLPDDWGRRVQDAEFEKIGLFEPTALDRLSFVGPFGIGALRYEPARDFERGHAAAQLADLRKAALRVLAGKPEEVADELLRCGGSAGGARPKFLVDLKTADLSELRYSSGRIEEGFRPVVLKVPDRGGDRYQRVEYAYMLMAREAGIDVPDVWLLTGERSGLAYLAIDRFDRDRGGHRLHAHTFAGLHNLDFREALVDYTLLLRTAHNLTRDLREAAKAYGVMLFNWLGFNNDDHAKNFTFLMDSGGRWRLSPAYDIAYSTATGGLHATALNGKRRNAMLEDLREIAADFDIDEWRVILDRTIDSLNRWPSFARHAGVPDRLSRTIGQRINENVRRLQRR